VRTIAREGVKNTHSWSRRTETATENRVGQAGSCRHCLSHSSLATRVAPYQWWVFCTPTFPCNIFHMLLETTV